VSGLTAFRNTVGGRLVEPAAHFDSFDPFTAQPWASIPDDGAAEADAAVAALG